MQCLPKARKKPDTSGPENPNTLKKHFSLWFGGRGACVTEMALLGVRAARLLGLVCHTRLLHVTLFVILGWSSLVPCLIVSVSNKKESLSKKLVTNRAQPFNFLIFNNLANINGVATIPSVVLSGYK